MHDFDWDVLQKKRIARGAAHMRNGSKSKQCFLPSDNLTRAQWKRRNGPVSTYKLDAPMNWDAFKEMPLDIQKQYVDNLRCLYRATDEMFGRMFYVSTAYFYRYRRDVLEITDSMPVLKGKENRERRDAMWSAFCNGVVGGNSEHTEDETVSEKCEDEVEIPIEICEEPKCQTDTLDLTELSAVFTGKFDPEAFLSWITKLPIPEANVRIKVEVTRV